jgi:hypothetical protein
VKSGPRGRYPAFALTAALVAGGILGIGTGPAGASTPSGALAQAVAPPDAPGDATASSEVQAQAGTELYSFTRQGDQSVRYRKYLGGNAWTDWINLGGVATFGPVPVVHGSDVYVFVVGTDNGLWYQKRVSGDGTSASHWSGWIGLGGQLTSYVAPVSAAAGLFLFARGTDNGLWYKRLNGSGTSPGDWSPWLTLGGAMASFPTAGSGPGGLFVFTAGTDNNGLWFNKLVSGNGLLESNWSGWSSLGGQLTSPPWPVSSGAGQFVFVRGTDNSMWYRKFLGPSWSAWYTLGGTLTSFPSAASKGTDLFVFTAGTDNNGLWYQRLPNNSPGGGTLPSDWTGWLGLGGQLTSIPIAAEHTTDGLFVFLRGTDGALYYRRLVGSGNSPSDWFPFVSLGGFAT